MDIEELKQKYIHTPTDEMYELSDCVEKYFKDKEEWNLNKLYMYNYDRGLLTHTMYWENNLEFHYGNMKYLMPDSISTIDYTLNEIDKFIDEIRIKNPYFFEKFPVSFMCRNSKYKTTGGLYNGKSVVAGEIKHIFEIPSGITETLINIFNIYTDGDITAKIDNEYDKDGNALSVSVKNYTVYLHDTRIYSSNGSLINTYCKLYA